MTPVDHPSVRRNLLRGSLTAGAALLAASGLVACDSAGPETGEVETGDLQALEDQVSRLEDRIGTLEQDIGVISGLGNAALAEKYIGQDVTVSAEVTEVQVMNDTGTAFRIAGNGGDAIAVISTTPPENLSVGDVARVSGTVQQVQQETFEEDFGVVWEDFFEDPSAFFDTTDVAIAADMVEILPGDE